MFHQYATVSDEAITQEVSGETVILDLRSEQYFSLDVVGTRIWQLLQEPLCLEEIHARLLEEYEVEPARLRQDLEDLVNRLCEVGLVTLVDQRG